MWYTGIDPFTKRPVKVARGLTDREAQRALMQFFKPDNYFAVREALAKAGRGDLIGGCDGLNPPSRPRRQLRADGSGRPGRRATTTTPSPTPAKGENPGERGAGPSKPAGYRPDRKSARRQERKKTGG